MTQIASRSALVAGTLALAALSGCAKPGPESAKPAADASQVEKALRDTETQWNAEYKAKDLAKITAHYAPDATLMQPGAPLMTGADAINKGLKEFLADPAMKLEFTADKVDVSASGDVAYTRGHFSVTQTNPATKRAETETGAYVTVYKKQADGAWKAVEDIASPGAPAPAVAATPAKSG